MKYYDQKYNRLVFINTQATPEFWDNQWNENIGNFKKTIKKGTRNIFMKKITKKYVQKGSKILEGGCGKGQNVYAFKHWGFDPYGIDFASETIKRINKIYPQLNIIKGDVRKLPYHNHYFDAYWSLGVIEHFYEGYDKIIKEMKRVVKNSGYVFITFPVMSRLRQFKAKRGYYPKFNDKLNLDLFYQFALDEKKVINDFEKYGFKLINKKWLFGFKGLKDEISLINPLFQKLYDADYLLLNAFKRALSILFSGISPHMLLLIFKKENE